MNRKGTAGAIAGAVKRICGRHEGVYRLLKKIGYYSITVLRSLRILLPEDLAYRLFLPQPPNNAGYVTKVNARGISGLAFRTAEGVPPKVELFVDGTCINRTWATQKVTVPTRYAGTFLGFYFPMKRVWRHVLRSHKIEVLSECRPLRYKAGPGAGKPLPNRGVYRLEDKSIAELVSEGHLITKFGRIQAPRDKSEAWAARAFGNYAELNEVFQRVTGKSLFVFYGVLLGYAREGGVLAHDMDLDLAYFSEQSEPDAVRCEFKTFAEKLIKAGVEVEPHSYKLQFGGKGLSVTPCWISSGVFSSTFGYVGDGYTIEYSDILPLIHKEHMGYGLLLPHNPVAVAAYLYGRGWKYPDPGWKWLKEYKNRPDILAARLKEADIRELKKRRAEHKGELL